MFGLAQSLHEFNSAHSAHKVRSDETHRTLKFRNNSEWTAH